MANLEIKSPPEFTSEIYKTEREDLLTAELENDIKGKLLNNDVFLKLELQEENKRAEVAESGLTENLQKEVDRAKAAEETNRSSLAEHTADKANPHKVTKAQVGLGNANNTSDIDKPVSTAQQNAIDSAYQQATGYTDQKIADLIGGAPKTLDTLKEIADAIEVNKDISTALDAAIGKKANQAELDTHTGNNTIHITVAERTLWNTVSNKVDKVSGKGLSTNDYTTTEKNKLAGIAANANNYTHPTTAGNKHIPVGGSAGQILRWSADGTAVWGNDNNTTYSTATQSTSGLMSSADKKKLDGITEGANKITIDSALNDTSTNPVQNKVIKTALDGKAASSHAHSNYFNSNTSRTQNTVLAAPSTGNGAASFRALTIEDLPTASASTNRNKVPVITANGVMEIGEYIDFHVADDANVDCDFRIRGTSTAIYFTQKNKAYGTLYAAAYSVASSRRYKNNIVNMPESDAEKLLDIDVKRFDYTIDDQKDVAGCIAEEVEKILPDVCSYQDENKTVVDGIDYSKFVPYLIKLAQKQQKQIEEMQKDIRSLKKYHNS